MTEESRPSRRPISLYCKPSARPREISSRSANINIARTAGILSHRLVKIKCYDRLNPRSTTRIIASLYKVDPEKTVELDESAVKLRSEYWLAAEAEKDAKSKKDA